MSGPDAIQRRIVKQLGLPDLPDRLVESISATDLQSMMIRVYQRRVEQLSARHILEQYEHNRFVRPARVDPRLTIAFDQMAFNLLPEEYDILELAPLAPLGSCSAVAPVSQDKIVSTARNTEVLADSTNVLALECAVRRRQLLKEHPGSIEPVRLCASQRVTRAQSIDSPASFAHFRLFSLCTAGRDRGSFRFEIESLTEQIAYYLELIELTRELGCSFAHVRVTVTAYEPTQRAVLQECVLEPLGSRFGQIRFEADHDRVSGKGYYQEVAFQIHVNDLNDQGYLIVDGGFTDWTRRYLSNQKERLLISGLGSERFLFCFYASGQGERS
ncbi:hypothetical protein JXQ70_14820 [bacterium]|nr:hypothetical protein [bacterium]